MKKIYEPFLAPIMVTDVNRADEFLHAQADAGDLLNEKQSDNPYQHFCLGGNNASG